MIIQLKAKREKKAGRTKLVWCYEYEAKPSGTAVALYHTRFAARIDRKQAIDVGYQCGPLFSAEITAPAWEPKGKKC
jgi:hypothetical protein